MKSITTLLKEAGKAFYDGLKAGSRYSSSRLSVSPARLLLLVIAGIVLVWTITTIANRIVMERLNNSVEICLDFDETVGLCQRNGYRLDEFLERCRLVGASSIALGEETLSSLTLAGRVRSNGTFISTADDGLQRQILRQLKERYGIDAASAAGGERASITPRFNSAFIPPFWTDALPLGFSRERTAFVNSLGYRAVVKVQNAGNPGWLEEDLAGDMSGIIFDGREVPGYPGSEGRFADIVRDNSYRIIAVEFTQVPGIEKLKRLVPQNIVLGHTVPLKEMGQNPDRGKLLARWQRGVRERGVRFVLFHFWEQRTIDENMAYLRSLAVGLKQEGYLLEPAPLPGYPLQKGTVGLWLALATVVSAPLLALVLGMRRRNALAAYITVNILTLLAGLTVAALLFDVRYMQKIIEIPAVKLGMLAPLLLAPFILYSSDERYRIWSLQLRLGHMVIAVLLLGMAAVLVIRSGNASASWLQPEHGIRQFFEQLMSIRPRTKEFLFGQPLLLLGFYFRRKELIWLGLIGQVSMMNTFLHAHTPVMISLIRSIHGVWLGIVVAGIVALLWKLFRPYRPLY